MWIDLPNLWIGLLNGLGIPVTHLLIAWGCTKLPASLWRAGPPRKPHGSGALYERVFLVRHWKHLLPDAAIWFGGIPKSSLQSVDPEFLTTFVAETRRGEFSHWLQLLVISSFIAWTPFPYALIIIAWACFSNIPCIISLRHTRLRVQRVRSRLESK